MPLYESTFIVRQDVSSQDADKIADDFSAIIKSNGGKVVKKESWGLRNLAYKINKNRKGHYFLLGVDASGEAVKELGRKARINEDILRNMTVRVEKISENPSPILQSDSSDDLAEVLDNINIENE